MMKGSEPNSHIWVEKTKTTRAERPVIVAETAALHVSGLLCAVANDETKIQVATTAGYSSNRIA
jgi:hypothetical protein